MKDIYTNTVSGTWITGELDTQYRIEENDSSITVTFQGSVSLRDWLQNFMFWKKLYKGSFLFCHTGFGRKWKAVQDTIMDRVTTAHFMGKEILIRGYSQGGALAELMHEDIAYQFQIQADTIVFGKPRVFIIHPKLKDRLKGITRVENGNDIVTKVSFFPYIHYGEVDRIGKKRKWFRFSIQDHLTYKDNL